MPIANKILLYILKYAKRIDLILSVLTTIKKKSQKYISFGPVIPLLGIYLQMYPYLNKMIYVQGFSS